MEAIHIFTCYRTQIHMSLKDLKGNIEVIFAMWTLQKT